MTDPPKRLAPQLPVPPERRSWGGGRSARVAERDLQRYRDPRTRGACRHADPAKTLTVQATIHVASGDVTVDLVPWATGHGKHGVTAAEHGHGHGRHRHGRGNVLKAKVPVAVDETLGRITVDVMFTYDGVAQPLVTVETEVVAGLDPEPVP